MTRKSADAADGACLVGAGEEVEGLSDGGDRETTNGRHGSDGLEEGVQSATDRLCVVGAVKQYVRHAGFWRRQLSAWLWGL